MSNVFAEILLIAVIFAAGITLCFTINLLVGVGFIVAANIALPTIIKLSQQHSLKQANQSR